MSTRDVVLFMSHVEHGLKDANGCWQWRGCIDKRGYGKCNFRGHTHAAHRAAYELFVGPIPSGLSVDHLCMNTACVNPLHLEAVSITENVQRSARMRTLCPNGHPYTPHNTRIRSGSLNSRVCKICDRIRAKSYNARKRAEKALICREGVA